MKHQNSGRHQICNMIYHNQNLFTIDIQNVRENCNLFVLFEERGKVLTSIYQDFFNNVEFSYTDFTIICNKVWKEPYNYTAIFKSKNKSNNGKKELIGIGEFCSLFTFMSMIRFMTKSMSMTKSKSVTMTKYMTKTLTETMT